ncbi:MAG: NifB/NifX family molybdenum-iron cluster-binding protein [Chitinivibrionales bacterium]|nr:NifB/NifX family molybdenum-iron cluster-binding protein [Chitinivibrionales bacterium]
MKIALSAQEPTPESGVDLRFGRAKCFMVYDDQSATWQSIDNVQNLQASQGAGIQSASIVVNAGCQVLISGHCGPKAFTALSRAGVEVYTVSGGSVAQALESFKQGTLAKMASADVEGHW